jgi:hypothetical protein
VFNLLQSELIAKCEAEFEEILRKRKAHGLATLTPEQANRIRQVIIARRAAMLRMRAGRQRNGSRLLPVGMSMPRHSLRKTTPRSAEARSEVLRLV